MLLALAGYNEYATARLLNTVEKLDSDQIFTEIGSDQRTVRLMLLHMMRTEAYYLAVCQGHDLDFDASRYNTLEEIRAYWDGLEHRMRRYIEKAGEEELLAARDFRLRDQVNSLPAWELLLQAFVHNVHHRGELAVLLKVIDKSLPTQDIYHHIFDQESQQRKE